MSRTPAAPLPDLAFERRFVAACAARARERGLSQSALARRAWPEHGDPGKRWRTLRNGAARLTLPEAYDLAQALGEDFAALCWRASR